MSAAAAVTAKLLQSCPTLCDPIEGSPPGSPFPGILQGRTLEWVAISFFNAWKWKVKVKSLSSVRHLVTPWTAAYQASRVHGIFQARVLEWVAIAFSRGFSWPRNRTCVSCIAGRFFTPGKPKEILIPELFYELRYLYGQLDLFNIVTKYFSDTSCICWALTMCLTTVHKHYILNIY